MFEKILIANRGEIACRIIRSARKLGIRTVAVHSEADAMALHVEMADEAIAIGPAPSAESYLVIERIIEACRTSGAQAVHPGFGFLAENAAFAEALEAAGIVFIGPPIPAIRAMGDKIESKKIAAAAKVSTVPGHIGVIESAEAAVGIAREIGYPVMIKASAGGGGKGMRIAGGDDEAREGFRLARSEARSSFGDDRVFIEKYIEEPRHIEIQVLADGHGNIVHLGERECSIQRRHQKVIEESPSPAIDPETRAAMGAEAVALARAVDYRSAGTVEFIFDRSGGFYFLETNTRLQVEHPVTELVTGLDLVEWMIRIAAGEALDFGQDDVRMSGWALEARVYAEDPRRDFLPSIGRLVRYREPTTAVEDCSVRVDSGVVEGSEISMFYDPMIAKLVTHGPDRGAAIAAMRAAIDEYYIRGVAHNLQFLAAVMANPRFQEGRLSTTFIAEEFPEGFKGAALPQAKPGPLLAAAALIGRRLAERDEGRARDDWTVLLEREAHRVTVEAAGGGYLVSSDVADYEVFGEWQPGEPVFRARINNVPVTIQVDRRGPALCLGLGGAEVTALVLRPRVAELAALMPVKAPPDLSKYLLSPMPGLLATVAVAEGQEVKAGEELVVVEAMKMENVLRAERDGVVAKLHAAVGDGLAVDQVILEFE